MRRGLRGATSARTSSAVSRSRLSILRDRSVSTRSFSAPHASSSSRTTRTWGSITDASAASSIHTSVHSSIHPWPPIRLLLAHVHFELLLGAIQFPCPVGISQTSRYAEVYRHASLLRDLQENVAEKHSAQVRDVAHGAAGVERIQERDGPDDHHEIFHFDGNQEA